jgi:hypothetical protein
MTSTNKRSWRTVSLRSLLALTTIIAIACAWVFQIRPAMIAVAGRNSAQFGCEYVDSVFGFDLPAVQRSADDTIHDPWWHVRLLSVPRLEHVSVSNFAGATIDPAQAALARSARCLEIGLGDESTEQDDAPLADYVSPATEKVELWAYGPIVSLRKAQCTWLERCPNLQELTIESLPTDYCLLSKLGEERGGVSKLMLHGNGAPWDGTNLAESLKDWHRLMHLYIADTTIDDRLIEQLCGTTRDLESFEFEGNFMHPVDISLDSLKLLSQLPHLTTLRLDLCGLTPEHIEVIAQMQQLKQLSLLNPKLSDADMQPLGELRGLTHLHVFQDVKTTAVKDDWHAREFRSRAVISFPIDE